jgi:cytoskeletal protein RodZ
MSKFIFSIILGSTFVLSSLVAPTTFAQSAQPINIDPAALFSSSSSTSRVLVNTPIECAEIVVPYLLCRPITDPVFLASLSSSSSSSSSSTMSSSSSVSSSSVISSSSSSKSSTPAVASGGIITINTTSNSSSNPTNTIIITNPTNLNAEVQTPIGVKSEPFGTLGANRVTTTSPSRDPKGVLPRTGGV